jgi:hypothetical protein
MLTDDEREALIRSLRDAGERIARSATLVKTREPDCDAAPLLQSAVLHIDSAIQRIALGKSQSA